MDNRESALTALRSSVAAMDAFEAALAHQVRECRRAGVSWQEIADATGVSKPTALTRWREDTPMTIMTTTDSTTWDIQPGEILRRRELHDRFGGNRQSGISTPKTGDNILLFTGNHADWEYKDGPIGTDRYQYNGEGLFRDQTMDRGNKAVLEHSENHKALRLFAAKGAGMVEYLGEYEYETHRVEKVRSKRNGEEHDNIVFTLRRR